MGPLPGRVPRVNRARDAADGPRGRLRHLRRPADRLSGRWLELVRFLGTGLVVSLLWLVPTIIASGVGATWFATVAFYGIYAHNSLPLSALARVLHFAGIGAGVIAIIGGAILISRRTRNAFWMLWVLAGIDLVVAGSAHFPYPHLLLPSIPWVCAAVVATPWNRWNVLLPLERPRLWVGSAVLAAGILLAAAQGSYAGSFWINGRSLSAYYANGYSSLVNATERTRWQNGFSDSIVVDQVVINWLKAHHYANTSAVVWSVADEWVYLLTPLNTVLPTVGLFNDDVLLGDRSKIGPYVARHLPAVIITNQPSVALRSSILTVVAQWYLPVFHVGPDTIYVERSGLSHATPTAAHRLLRTHRSAA